MTRFTGCPYMLVSEIKGMMQFSLGVYTVKTKVDDLFVHFKGLPAETSRIHAP